MLSDLREAILSRTFKKYDVGLWGAFACLVIRTGGPVVNTVMNLNV
jgi:hypothetical protein